MTRYILGICLIGYFGQAIGQESRLDSLLGIINKGSPDSTTVRVYLEIANEYMRSGDERAVEWNSKAVSLAKSSGFAKGLYRSHMDLASYYIQRGEFSKALERFHVASTLCDSIGYEEGKYESLFQMGVTLRRTGDYDKSIERLLSAREYFSKSEDKRRQGRVDLELGIVHDLIKDLPEAMRYYRRSLSLYLSLGDKNGQARSYHVIAANYYHQQKFEKSIEYSQKSMAILEELGNNKRVSSALGNIASCYVRLGDFRGALKYYRQSLDIKEEFADKPGMAMMYANIGNCYSELGDYTSAKNYISKSLQLTEEVESPYILENSLHQLYKIEERQGNFKEAYDAYERFMEVQGELVLSRKLGKIEDVKAQYAFKAEKDSINQEQRKQELIYEAEKAEQEATMNALFIALSSTLAVAFFFSYVFLSRRKRNRALEDANLKIKELRDELDHQNRIKSKLFSIIAHDLRGPITVFLGYYELLLEHLQEHYQAVVDTKLNSLSNNIKLSASRILELLDGLINWALKEEGVISYRPEEIDLEECILGNSHIIADQARMKNIKIDTALEKDVKVWADKSSLMAIIRNLASNALKFTPENGYVKFSTAQEKNHAVIEIEDSGVGIPKEKLANLFEISEDKSAVGTNGEQGTGLGLNIVHDFVKMNKGDISVSSKVGEGTVFYLRVPISN